MWTPIDGLVVELDDRYLQLRDDQVLVVAGIADQRPLVRVSLQVGPRHLRVGGTWLAEAQLDPARLVQERLVGGAAAVERVEIEPGRAEVGQRVRVVLPHQARDRIEGDVVVDELPEIGVSGRQAHRPVAEDTPVLVGVRDPERLVELSVLQLLDHRVPERGEALRPMLVERQPPEHAPKPSRRRR